MEKLPKCVLIYICQYLTTVDISNLRLTNKHFADKLYNTYYARTHLLELTQAQLNNISNLTWAEKKLVDCFHKNESHSLLPPKSSLELYFYGHKPLQPFSKFSFKSLSKYPTRMYPQIRQKIESSSIRGRDLINYAIADIFPNKENFAILCTIMCKTEQELLAHYISTMRPGDVFVGTICKYFVKKFGISELLKISNIKCILPQLIHFIKIDDISVVKTFENDVIYEYMIYSQHDIPRIVKLLGMKRVKQIIAECVKTKHCRHYDFNVFMEHNIDITFLAKDYISDFMNKNTLKLIASKFSPKSIGKYFCDEYYVKREIIEVAELQHYYILKPFHKYFKSKLGLGYLFVFAVELRDIYIAKYALEKLFRDFISTKLELSDIMEDLMPCLDWLKDWHNYKNYQVADKITILLTDYEEYRIINYIDSLALW